MGVLALILAAVLAWGPGYVERGRNAVSAHAPYPVSEEAQALHNSLVIGDWHADSLLWNRDITKRASRGHVDLPRLQEGNVAVQVFTAVTKSPAGQNIHHNSADARDNITLLVMGQLWPRRTWGSLYERAVYQAQKLQRAEAARPDLVRIVRTRADLEAVLTARAGGSQQVAALLGIEGAHPLEASLEKLDGLEAQGYRVIALQHFFDNALGGSLHGSGNVGLSDFGAQVVREVEARGMVLDLAHSSPKVVEDVLSLTDMPLVISHTGLHSMCKVKRNLPDALMKRVVASGGVIGIGYWTTAACDETPEGIARMIAGAVQVLGEDHVSLGSDFDGSVRTGFDTSELAALTQALLNEGVSDVVIRKVMGENLLRVLRARLPAK